MALVFLAALCAVVSIITLPSESAGSYRQESEEECTSSVCQETAQALLASMDFTANPCQDFYRYACGGWINSHPIPPEKSKYTAFDALIDEVSDNVAAILTNATRENHPRPVRQSALFFQSCMDKEARETQGLTPLRNLLTSIGGWPMTNPQWTSAGYQWQTQVANIIRDLDISPMISLMVGLDSKDTSQHIISLGQPYFDLGRNALVNLNSSDRKGGIIAAYKSYIVATGKLMNPNIDEAQLQNDAEQIMQFESSLAQHSMPQEERRNASLLYNKMTVAKAQIATQNTHFEWKDFLNNVFLQFPEVTDETEIILKEKDYIKNVVKLGHETNARILANYIGWIVLKATGPQTTIQFRDNEFNFQRVLQGIEEKEKLERICTQETIYLLGFAVGRLYVDRYFTEAQKRDADQLVDNIRSAYKSTLSSNTWMDAATKNKAINKLEAMVNHVGYPPWIKNNKRLNNYYRSVPNVNRNKYFQSRMRITKAIHAKHLGKWNQPTDRANDWIAEPPVVEAFYYPAANSITFPAGIWGLPFYKYNRPQALNYGAIGTVIGHEISHGFDDQGGQYDSQGNLVNWWSEEIKDEFKEKADCFRAQYSSYVEPATNMHLNGNNTVGENIGDNGGVRNSFLAFKMQQRRPGINNKRLPGVPVTADQLFFLGYSSIWCGAERTESLPGTIQYDPHAPANYRAVIPLINSEAFAEAFSCPLGSPMNPEDKCLLW